MMSFLMNLLNVFVTLCLLSSPASALDLVSPQRSLWGKMADFTYGCSHWKLRPDVSIPALQQLTVCMHLQVKVPLHSHWTAFMYRSAEGQWAELGLGGKYGRIVVWLFGIEWITSPIQLPLDQWHYLCLTWSDTSNTPSLYLNGSMVILTVGNSLLMSPSRSQLAPNGTLTLGAAHLLSNGELQIVPVSRLKGRLSLFRMWGRARTEQEVMSQKCTEGDVVKWEEGNWGVCRPDPDPTLRCDWSMYEVRLRFLISRYDRNSTDQYTARDIAHSWLRHELPSSAYLHSVSVLKLTRAHSEDSLGGLFHDNNPVQRANPHIDRFDCLVHVNVIPSLDVAVVQKQIYTDLQHHYTHGLLQLMACPRSIYTTAIESFCSTTVSPTVSVMESSAVTTSASLPTPSLTTTAKPSSTTTPTSASSTTTTSTTTSQITASTFTSASSNTSELYFEVKVNVSMKGNHDPEQSLSIWLNSALPKDEMTVLNFQLLTYSLRRRRDGSVSEAVTPSRYSRESCVFQVKVMRSWSSADNIEREIRYLLQLPYDSGSVTVAVAAQDIQISRILIFECPAHTHQTRKGLFEWPATMAHKNASQPCPGKPRYYATRHCKLSLSTQWLTPDLDQCPLVVKTIPDLDHVDVTAGNALDVVEMIESLLSDHSTLSYHEMVTVLNKLKAVVCLGLLTPKLGRAVVDIISVILQSDTDLLPFTNTILNITEALGDRMWGYDGSSTLVSSAMAISVVDVDPGHFDSLTFGVSSIREGLNPEIYINKEPFNGTVAFISLPVTLQHSFPQDSQTPPRVQFQFYGIPVLFKRNEHILNTYVVSASVTNASLPIKDLDEDVTVTLRHLAPNRLNKDVKCVFWNFNKNSGHGGWDDQGCRTHKTGTDYTTCLCNHLTHFGVLLDVSRTQVDPANEKILTFITYLGCGVSSLFLGVTVVTYTAFEKLRRDYPSQILINLSLALLGLNLVFLVNSWLSSWGLYGLCVAAASTLHYFLLASFTWMGLEAVNMYFALVKVFNVYVPSYILKFCILGWGLPLVVCVLVLIVDREAYGSHLYRDAQPSMDDFCWLQDDVAFYVSVVSYAVLVFLFNIAVFVVVLIQIRHMRVNRPAGIRSGLLHDLKGVVSLTLLLGLTWTVGFFTWGPARVPLLYLFSGLNTLQGLFIFLFHCLMKENVRKQWRIHLCFGRFRLKEYSDWSHTASVGAMGRSRPNPPVPPVPSVRSVKSSATNSTSASSDSSHRDLSTKRPDLGLFVNGLALPRAQRSPTPLPCRGSTFPERDEPYAPGWTNHMLR